MRPHHPARRVVYAVGLAAALGVVAGSGAEVRQPAPALAGSANDLLRCQKTLAKEGTRLVAYEQRGFTTCHQPLLACALLRDTGGDAAKVTKCFAKASKGCQRVLGKIRGARDRKQAKVQQGCGALAIEDVRATDGLGYGLLPCGQETTTAAFLGCLDQLVQPKTEILTGHLAARIGRLLDEQGLGNDFPNLPRP